MTWRQRLNAIIDDQFPDVVALRRYLHQHPEVSGEEFATSKLLAERVTELGLDVRMGPEDRGVVADLPSSGDSTSDSTSDSIFAIRGDIDALRIQDAKQVAYASQNSGVMHACGHDAHAALAYGSIRALADMQNEGELPPDFRCRAIFQPAEETCRGALEMIAAGALEGVAALIAAHVDPQRTLGAIGVRPGVLTANCDHLRVTVRGQGGHAARPHKTRDPILAATELISSLYAHVRREDESESLVVIAFGQILGGHNGNVIPDDVTLNGTLRTLDAPARTQAKESVHRIAKAVGDATRTAIEVEFASAADAVVNCPQLTELIGDAARSSADSVTVEAIEKPSMGGEDFAFYGNHVPAAMFRLGVTSDQCGGAPLHTPGFDLDERAIKIGIRIMAYAAVAWCERKYDKSGGIVTT